MKKIEELSKTELLSLIYHELPDTYFKTHPVQCASCGTIPHDQLQKVEYKTGNKTFKLSAPMYSYMCDACEGLLDG